MLVMYQERFSEFSTLTTLIEGEMAEGCSTGQNIRKMNWFPINVDCTWQAP